MRENFSSTVYVLGTPEGEITGTIIRRLKENGCTCRVVPTKSLNQGYLPAIGTEGVIIAMDREFIEGSSGDFLRQLVKKEIRITLVGGNDAAKLWDRMVPVELPELTHIAPQPPEGSWVECFREKVLSPACITNINSETLELGPPLYDIETDSARSDIEESEPSTTSYPGNFQTSNNRTRGCMISLVSLGALVAALLACFSLLYNIALSLSTNNNGQADYSKKALPPKIETALSSTGAPADQAESVSVSQGTKDEKQQTGNGGTQENNSQTEENSLPQQTGEEEKDIGTKDEGKKGATDDDYWATAVVSTTTCPSTVLPPPTPAPTEVQKTASPAVEPADTSKHNEKSSQKKPIPNAATVKEKVLASSTDKQANKKANSRTPAQAQAQTPAQKTNATQSGPSKHICPQGNKIDDSQLQALKEGVKNNCSNCRNKLRQFHLQKKRET